MDENKEMIANEPVSYIVFESELARQERTIKKLWMLVLVLITLFVGTNGAWIYYESQFEDVKTTVVQSVDTADGGDAVVNGTGELTVNGEDTTNHND